MYQTPIRHMLFFSILLFIILSSGSLQCALNCYDHAMLEPADKVLVTDCHPREDLTVEVEQVSSFCHRNHSSSQASDDPILSSLSGGPALALFNARFDAPEFRSAEPFLYQVLAVSSYRTTPLVLPQSQILSQIRSTILLM